MPSLKLPTNFNHAIDLLKLMDRLMQDSLNSISDDEIDLRELFVTLWAHKLFIACACALGIVFGGYLRSECGEGIYVCGYI
jgi:LPS O-antigen subunit length determinant protein (WzzB/FepE family)